VTKGRAAGGRESAQSNFDNNRLEGPGKDSRKGEGEKKGRLVLGNPKDPGVLKKSGGGLPWGGGTP